MPRVIDNIDLHLSAVLRNTMQGAQRADFCVGYFNLRGWKNVSDLVEGWSGQNGACCRLLVGMQRAPQDELRAALSLNPNGEEIDNGRALDLRKRVAADFRQQLTLGTPSDEDERGLRCLSEQLKSRKLVVKLFLRHTLHAKLYMVYQNNFAMPIVPYVGSSNLTYAGLRSQGELNVDVADNDAAEKLQRWFEDRWNDRFCIDISAELAQIIDESWARPEIISPYHIYLAMAYHLSQEARIGVNTFRLPREFEEILFDFQTKAVQIAAHHLNKRGGVVVGDVVGLGKTLIGTALARVFQDDIGTETLIICPKNLAKMWQEHVDQYRLVAKVVPLTMVESELPDLRRYRMVLIDESHNLRNREGKRYRVIRDYINANDSRCILLSATPYNKTYEDLSNQLRLFIPDGQDLGVRPERKLKDVGETEFIRRHQCSLRSLEAFDKSEYADDWRELMRLYLVRRTRSFIQANYAETDPDTGRKFLRMADGTPSFFPNRVPKTVAFEIRDADPGDPYARLYSSTVVDAINALSLPRYGLGSYVEPGGNQVTEREQKIIADLSRGGKRLMGFCRTNLFKRLESGGPAFLQSIERHILRNFIMLHAIEAGQEIPIGTQDAEFLEVETSDRDPDPVTLHPTGDELAETPGDELTQLGSLRTEQDYRRRAAEVYAEYAAGGKRRFRWLRSTLFTHALRDELEADARSLLRVREFCGHWEPARDTKLGALAQLLQQKHRSDKVLVFTQYADTVEYLTRQLRERGVNALAGVTGDTEDPTEMARRFSPHSNQRPAESPHELRVMIATDVLSEGQNLQDCHIVVNYDLPWAIIRLIQRAGRVDRIGQTAERILAYTFLPAEGVERIISLRTRVQQRLRENDEVVGGDESFFEGDLNRATLHDLFTEKTTVLDGGDAEGEVDLASYAYQIWKNATDSDPSLRTTIEQIPALAYSSRAHQPSTTQPEGVLVYVRTAEENDVLGWVTRDGRPVTESQRTILDAARCLPDTPALERDPGHHELVRTGVEHLLREEQQSGGQLGRPSGARFRTYEQLKQYANSMAGTMFSTVELVAAIEEIYRYPLLQTATDTLNRQLRSGIDRVQLVEIVLDLRREGKLCQVRQQEEERREPQIICSLGLFRGPAHGSQGRGAK